MSVHALKKNPDERPTASIIYIDPPMARRVLEKNTRNRPISELHVQRLLGEMKSGRWQYNGEAIKWSTDNVILDGQHRLTALSRLDDSFSLPFLVVRGLPTSAQNTMDQGRTRTAGDQLNIDGLTEGADSKIVAGAIRVYAQWMNGGLFGDVKVNRVGNPEVIEWAKDHPMEIAIMADILRDNRVRRVKARPSLTLAVLLRLHLIDGQAAREFSEKLFSGVGLESGDPILTLRERLDRIRTQAFQTPDRDMIAFFLIAWNAWRSGRKMDKFQRPAGGTWTAEKFPVAR